MTTTHALPPAREAVDALKGILDTNPFDVYRSDVPNDIALGSDGKARGYAVIHAGTPTSAQARLSPQPEAKSWPFQITAVGGDDQRCLWVVDLVLNMLTGLRLEFGSNPTWITTPIRQEPGGPDRVQIDRGINPPRFWLPLIFRCRISSERKSNG